MRKRSDLFALCTAGVIFAGLAASAILASGEVSRAQAPSPGGPAMSEPLPDNIAVGEVPFFADWAASPHADRKAEAFNHWNKEGKVAVPCARCHSTPGFRDFIGADGSAAGVLDGPAPVGSVITCNACHSETARALTSVVFPSGLRAEDLGPDARCMTCHQGLAAGADVDKAVAGLEEDQAKADLAFVNVHYRAAGATLMGTLARVAYQYPGKIYAGRFRHPEPFSGCTGCHELHKVAPKVEPCAACHEGIADRRSLRRIRKSTADFDGNGNASEGIAQEVEHLHARLLEAIMTYARSVAGKAIAYEAHAYPYFFIDTNGNGVADKEEARVPNKYNAWTPRLLKAAYNYQFVAKDPGAYAHNPAYTLQILYDSLADLGAKVAVRLDQAKRP